MQETLPRSSSRYGFAATLVFRPVVTGGRSGHAGVTVNTGNVLTFESIVLGLDELLRQAVRDTHMAIDTGLSFILPANVPGPGTRLLGIGVHECEAVAIAALPRVRRPHVCPHYSGEMETLRDELLPGVDAAAQPMEKLVGSPNFPHHHVMPIPGDVAIGTGSPHPGAVAVMHRVPVFTVDVVPHLMAGDTERFPIGDLEGGVEGSPEENSGQEQTKDRNQWAAGGEAE